jgi:butyryl-CoA dehydrogenase
MHDGAAFKLFIAKLEKTIATAKSDPELKGMAEALQNALHTLIQSTQEAWSTGNAHETLANATSYLRAFGHVTLAWIWLELAITSNQLISDKSHDTDFLKGKLAAAHYFFDFELPLIHHWLTPVRHRNAICNQMNPNWF